MQTWFKNDLYEGDLDSTTQRLAECLRDGTLALLIGAGASMGLGFPSWKELVESCAKASTVDYSPEDLKDNDGIVRLTSKIERLAIDSQAYIEAVHSSLYKHSATDLSDFLRQDLLLAFGSLLMKSRRGSVREVITYNFDDALERYLAFYGFSTQVIHHLPQLVRDDDVTIYHPHGFVPRDNVSNLSSKSIVFSKNAFDRRLGDHSDPWTQLVSDVLTRKVGLFVGLSVEGPNFGPAMHYIKSRIGETRPTGFWFVRDGDTDRIDQLRDWGAVPIAVKDYSDIPEFLFGICQRALVIGK